MIILIINNNDYYYYYVPAPKESLMLTVLAGWRSVLEVLIVAAADSAAAVVNQALDALQPVIAALYADVGVGHQHFLGIVTAVATTMRSPYHAELSISAVHVMQSVASRLAQSDPQVGPRTVCTIQANHTIMKSHNQCRTVMPSNELCLSDYTTTCCMTVGSVFVHNTAKP